jgi:signal recognition particle subunit SRP54
MMKRFQKGQFNMNDLKGQLQQMQKMGGMQGVMGMLPGMAKMSKQMDEAGLDDRMLRRQIALIDSMTKRERRNPELLQASRKRRVAAGAGLEVQELNRLLKMHRQMADVMKKMGGMGKKGMLRGIIEARDAAYLLAWLTSEENAHLCGQVVFIDGGSDVVIRGDSTF